MTTINFNEITLLDIEGNEQKVSISRELGNTMYMRGENIEEAELGRKIYNGGKQNEPIEVTEEEVGIISKYITGYSFIVRQAIMKQLGK